MTELRIRMLQDMQLHGSQELYPRAVRQPAEHYHIVMNPRKRDRLKAAQALFDATSAPGNCRDECLEVEKPPIIRCPKCGAPLVFVREILPLRQSERFTKACRAP